MNSLQFAIEMEHEGEKFYMEQAELNKKNDLKVVCELLAADEKEHAKMLTDKMNHEKSQFPDTNTLADAKNIFTEMTPIQSGNEELKSQISFYRNALEIEQQSVDFYMKYQKETTDDGEKKLFDFLIQQEKTHLAVLGELYLLLKNAKDWVENAEFGLREDY